MGESAADSSCSLRGFRLVAQLMSIPSGGQHDLDAVGRSTGAVWGADAVQEDLRECVVEHLVSADGDPDAERLVWKRLTRGATDFRRYPGRQPTILRAHCGRYVYSTQRAIRNHGPLGVS